MEKLHARLDRITLGKASLDSEGLLRAPAVLAVEGVHEYRTASGTRREYVPADVLADAESVATLEGVPVVFLHPTDHPEGLVTAQTAQKHAVGAVAGTPRMEGGELKARLLVHRRDAIDALERGTRELSCGYWAQVDATPGIWTDADGVQHAYDVKQVRRVYNHVAIVPAGRHGSRARVYLDSHDGAAVQTGPEDETPFSATPPQEPAMKFKVRIDGQTLEVEVASPEEGQFIQAAIDKGAQARTDAASEREKLQGRIDALTEEVNKAKADADKARTDAAITPERLQARIDRVDAAAKCGVQRDQAVKMTDGELLRAIVQARYPEMDLKGRTDAAVEAMAEIALADARKDGLRQAAGQGSQQTAQGRTDAGSEPDPYQAFHRTTVNGWRASAQKN
jgi:hypothetical protein